MKKKTIFEVMKSNYIEKNIYWLHLYVNKQNKKIVIFFY